LKPGTYVGEVLEVLIPEIQIILVKFVSFVAKFYGFHVHFTPRQTLKALDPPKQTSCKWLTETNVKSPFLKIYIYIYKILDIGTQP